MAFKEFSSLFNRGEPFHNKLSSNERLHNTRQWHQNHARTTGPAIILILSLVNEATLDRDG